jgi:hypothetical protein
MRQLNTTTTLRAAWPSIPLARRCCEDDDGRQDERCPKPEDRLHSQLIHKKQTMMADADENNIRQNWRKDDDDGGLVTLLLIETCPVEIRVTGKVESKF